MNTTTNTRGVSEAMYTPEKVEAIAQELYKAPATSMWGSRVSVPTDKAAAAYEALIAYAATLRQNPERRVSTEEVRLSLDYSRNFARANPRLSKTTVEHIEGLCNLVERLAALSAEPAVQGEDYSALVEAMELPAGYEVTEQLPGIWQYEFDREKDGERMASCTSWNHPALAAIGAWQDHVEALSEAAPPAQPAERVPDGWVLVPREALGYVSDLLAERKHGTAGRSPAHNARIVVDYWLAASPAPSEGGKGVEGE